MPDGTTLEAADNAAYGMAMSEIYDLVYRGLGKDYAAEAAAVAALVRARRPDAVSLLDVACGTGEHLVALRALFGEVAGLDLAAGMRAVASRKLPGVPVHAGDMRGFALGRAFDAMCCLYSAVGYMSTAAELDAALERMAAHLTPGGVLVVEPWWTPGRFLDGHIADDVVRAGGRTISRVSLSTRDGGAARQETHYTVAGQDGIRSFVHVQRLTLFRPEDYAAAFRRAGLKAEYTAHDAFRSGRGLYVGVREGGGR